MSTKIYDAYKFKGSFQGLMVCLRKIREDHFNDRYQKYWKLAQESYEATKELLYCKHANRQYNKHSAVVYEHNDDIYVQFFMPAQFVPDTDVFEDYHYQNQSDPYYMDDVYKDKDGDWLTWAEEEYDEREIVWNEIFSDVTIYSTPKMRGLTFEMVDEIDHIRFMEMLREDLNDKL